MSPCLKCFFFLPLLFLFLSSQASSIRLPFCCPEGSVAKLKKIESPLLLNPYDDRLRTLTECVPIEESAGQSTLNNKVVIAVDKSKEDGDPLRYQEITITRWNDNKRVCSFGAKEIAFSLNITGVEILKPMSDMEIRNNEWMDQDARPGVREGFVAINRSFICNENFEDVDAKVACRTLGYQDGEKKESKTWPPYNDYLMTNVDCQGNETSIFNCSYETTDDCGYPLKGAKVLCRWKGRTNTSLALDGSLQLPDEEVQLEVPDVWRWRAEERGMVHEFYQDNFCLSPGQDNMANAVLCWGAEIFLVMAH